MHRRERGKSPPPKMKVTDQTPKILHERRNCWGKNPWQLPEPQENINEWIRRLYEESLSHPELIQCLNEYTNVLVKGSSIEDAKVILDKIDVIGFTEEFSTLNQKLLDALQLPEDSLDEFKIPKQKEVPSEYKKSVSEIGEEEMKMLHKLLKDDVELYKYAFEKYSDYAKQHPGEIKPFH